MCQNFLREIVMNLIAVQERAIDAQINFWRNASNQQNEITTKLQSCKRNIAQVYSQMSSWDSFVNIFPSFVSSALSTDYSNLANYNRLCADSNCYNLQYHDLQSKKDQIISQIFTTLMRSESSFSDQAQKYSMLVQKLISLEQTAHNVILQLKRAENSEWRDGMSSDSNPNAAFYDYQSRQDNFRVANLLQNLNSQVLAFNSQLTMDLTEPFIPALKELCYAGDAIVDAELNESSFVTLFTGDFWQSRNTLHVLETVEADVCKLHQQIEDNRVQLQHMIKQLVINELNIEHSDFVLEAGLQNFGAQLV